MFPRHSVCADVRMELSLNDVEGDGYRSDLVLWQLILRSYLEFKWVC